MHAWALDRVVVFSEFPHALRRDLSRALGCRQWIWARETRTGSGVEWRVASEGTPAPSASENWTALCQTLLRARQPRRGPGEGEPTIAEKGWTWLLDSRPGRRSVVVAVIAERPAVADPALGAALGAEMRAAYARSLAVERIERECALCEALLESSAEGVLLLDWDLKPVARPAGATARLGRRSGESLPDAVRRRLYLMRATWERALLAWEKPEDETALLAGPDGSGVEIRMLAGREPEAACPQFLLRFRPPAARRDPAAADWPSVAICHNIDPTMLRLLAEGSTTGRMASAVGVSPAAIRARLSRLYRRFGCAGRIALLRRLAEGSPS